MVGVIVALASTNGPFKEPDAGNFTVLP